MEVIFWNGFVTEQVFLEFRNRVELVSVLSVVMYLLQQTVYL